VRPVVRGSRLELAGGGGGRDQIFAYSSGGNMLIGGTGRRLRVRAIADPATGQSSERTVTLAGRSR
jgi:hypothetical protein